MGILGNVENGWFATVAHGCQSVSQASLNFVSCGNHWGDNLYTGMESAANNYVASVNQAAINQAVANGATPHQALSAGSAALEKIADPTSLRELSDLASHGTAVIGQTVSTAMAPAPSPDFLGVIAPMLIGAGVILGGTYIVADNFFSSGPSPSPSRYSRARLETC